MFSRNLIISFICFLLAVGAAPTEDTLKLDECISVCEANTCEENGSHTMGTNQMLTCTNACFMRHIGASNSECLGHCDRHGGSGCFLKVNDVNFNMCGVVSGSSCFHGNHVSVSDCELGCNSYSEGQVTYECSLNSRHHTLANLEFTWSGPAGLTFDLAHTTGDASDGVCSHAHKDCSSRFNRLAGAIVASNGECVRALNCDGVSDSGLHEYYQNFECIQKDTTVPFVPYRYYRIDVSQNAGADWWCIEELSFYGMDGKRLILNKAFASAQSAYSSRYAAEMAFNEMSDADDSYYCSLRGFNNGWLAYDFQSPVALSKYAIERLNGYGNKYSPTTWTFEGSFDGISWTTLDVQSGQNQWKDGEVKEFTINHPTIPAYWKSCRWQSTQDKFIDDSKHLVGWTCADNEILTGFGINAGEDDVSKIQCCELGGHSSVIPETCTLLEAGKKGFHQHELASCNANDHMVFSGAYDASTLEDDDFTEILVGKCCEVKCDAPWCRNKDWGVNTDPGHCHIIFADGDKTKAQDLVCPAGTLVTEIRDGHTKKAHGIQRVDSVRCCELDLVSQPTSAPSTAPSTTKPTPSPTSAPTTSPTKSPTPSPTNPPSPSPTTAPSPSPTTAPSVAPTSTTDCLLALFQGLPHLSDAEILQGMDDCLPNCVVPQLYERRALEGRLLSENAE